MSAHSGGELDTAVLKPGPQREATTEPFAGGVAWPLAPLGGMVAVFATLVVAGYLGGPAWLTDFGGRVPVMPLASAAIFLLHGLAIVAHAGGLHRVAIGLLLGTAALAMWAALAHAGLHVGFQTLSAVETGAGPTWAIRPSIVTVVATLALLAGVAASHRASPRLHRMAGVLMSLGLAGGALVALGYFLGERSAFSWGPLAPVSPQTALLVILLGVGWLQALWRRDAGDAALPEWAPEAVSAGMITLVLSLALVLAIEARTALEREAGVKLASATNELAFRFGTMVDALDRMAERLETRGPATDASWEGEARSYFKGFPAIAVLGLRDARGTVTQASWASEASPRPMHFPTYPIPPGPWPAAGAGYGTSIVTLPNGRLALWTTLPRPGGGELLALLRIERFLGEAFPPEVAIGYGVRVHHLGQILFSRAWPERYSEALVRRARIERQGGHFEVTVVPGEAEHRGLLGLPVLAAALGTVLAITVGMLLRAARANRLRSREVDRLAREVAGTNDRLEQLVAERTAQLATTNRELELFAYTVAHDLRAPMRHIVSFGRELEEHVGASLDPEGRRLLEVVTRSAQKQSDFIHELLEYARLGDIAVRDESVDLDSVVGEVVAAYRTEAQEPPTRWNVGQMPPVRGDALLLRQAIANLVGNAVKFTRKSASPQIDIEAAVKGGTTTVTIRDNGAGFDARYAGKLFTPFHRLHHAGDFPGSGMGLAIVRRVAERLGGAVSATSRPGEGAAFSLTLRSAA